MDVIQQISNRLDELALEQNSQKVIIMGLACQLTAQSSDWRDRLSGVVESAIDGARHFKFTDNPSVEQEQAIRNNIVAKVEQFYAEVTRALEDWDQSGKPSPYSLKG